jgi:hypothetical protein
VRVYDAIELQLEGDDWLSIAAWSFHQALNGLAKSKIAAGETTLRPADVSFEWFDRLMRKNLADASWSAISGDYESSRS